MLAQVVEVPKDVIHQGILEAALRVLFPNENIKTNVKKETEIRNTDSDAHLEFDMWIPSLNLFFEFQDEYHYENKWYSTTAISQMLERDNTKREQAQSRGITVVVVPCWWNGAKESLSSTILCQRPDLQHLWDHDSFALPIPFNHPVDFFTSITVYEVGELMLATFPSSLTFASSITNNNPWWMGEKYDGIRACWVYSKRNLYSRRGLIFSIPRSFFPLLPPIILDGEMWLGRTSFTDLQTLMKAATTFDHKWSQLRITAFDSPRPASSPFEKRYQLLLDISPSHPFLVLAPRMLCTSPIQLYKNMSNVMRDAGEGVILRRPNSLYTPGRSKSLWKIKAARADKEALVKFVNPVKCEARLQLPEGIEFSATYEERMELRRGDIVTFSYDHFTSHSTPQNPSILRVRKDLSWDDVLREAPVNDSEEVAKVKPPKYWTAENSKKTRLYLEHYALSKNLDPLLASTWYNAASDFGQLKEANSILANHKGSFATTVVQIFPDINFDLSKFSVLQNKYWHDVKNRRKFFDNFAREQGFDPLHADNWYSSDTSILRRTKGVQSILNYYDSSIIHALIHAYPDIGLREDGFTRMPVGYWQSHRNQRKFFEKFASEKNFDPLVPDNWYAVLREDLLAFGAGAVLGNFSGSYVKAVVNIFSEVKFDTEKFSDLDRKRRRAFLDFAKRHNFDPLVASNWYAKKTQLLAEKESMSAILRHYDGKVRKALLHLFPSVGLSAKQFRF